MKTVNERRSSKPTVAAIYAYGYAAAGSPSSYNWSLPSKPYMFYAFTVPGSEEITQTIDYEPGEPLTVPKAYLDALHCALMDNREHLKKVAHLILACKNRQVLTFLQHHLVQGYNQDHELSPRLEQVFRQLNRYPRWHFYLVPNKHGYNRLLQGQHHYPPLFGVTRHTIRLPKEPLPTIPAGPVELIFQGHTDTIHPLLGTSRGDYWISWLGGNSGVISVEFANFMRPMQATYATLQYALQDLITCLQRSHVPNQNIELRLTGGAPSMTREILGQVLPRDEHITMLCQVVRQQLEQFPEYDIEHHRTASPNLKHIFGFQAGGHPLQREIRQTFYTPR